MSQIDSTKGNLSSNAAVTGSKAVPVVGADHSAGAGIGVGRDWPRLQRVILFFVLFAFVAFVPTTRFDEATLESSSIPLILLAIGIFFHMFAHYVPAMGGAIATAISRIPKADALGAMLKQAAERIPGIEYIKTLLAAIAARSVPLCRIGGLILAMAMAWQHAFSEMWLRWFPGWEIHKGAGFTTRISAGDSYYSHAPLVPIASLIIAAVVVHKRVGFPCKRTKSSAIWGSLMMALVFMMQFVASRGDVTFVAGFALIGVIASLTVLWGGWPLLRAYFLPIAFLFFMVPLPMDTVAKLNFGLKVFASDVAVWLTNHVFGVVALLKGASIDLMADPETGAPKTLVVENVCSGLRSLISLICFGSLFAMMCRVRGYWRLFMLAMAVPLAIACNVARITSMTLVSHYVSVEAAGEGSWFHTFSGLMVFALALAAMFGLEQVIAFAGRKLKRNWSDPRIMGYLDDMPPVKEPNFRSFHPVALTALIYIFSLSVLYGNEESTMNRTNVAAEAVAATLTIDGDVFISKREEMSKLEMSILQTEDYLKRRYFVENNPDKNVDLTIVFSANNRKGTHPPDVCLEGGGGRIVKKTTRTITFTVQGENGPEEREIELKELISQRPIKLPNGQYQHYKNVNLYVYKCGSTYTASYLWQQLVIFVNGVVDRNASGALIRIDAPIGWETIATEKDEQRAREIAIKAAKVFMSEIDAGLP